MKKLLILFTPSHLTKWKEAVSIRTAMDIKSTLDGKYDVSIYEFNGFTDELLLSLKKCDIIFNICYGYYKDNVDISQVDVVKWLDDNRITHNVSKYECSLLALDKSLYTNITKEITELNSPRDISKIKKGKVIKKERFGACHRNIQIYESVKITEIDSNFIYQEYIRGREFSIYTISGSEIRVLYPYEVISDNDIFIFGSETTIDIKPEISQILLTKINKAIVDIHSKFNFIGLTRTDLKIDKDNNIYLLDINTMPNIDKTLTIILKSIEASNMTYNELINNLI